MAKKAVKAASNRRATNRAERYTDSYSNELQSIVDKWFSDLEGKDAYDIDAEIAILVLMLQNAATRHYKRAYQLGLNNQELDAEDLRKIDAALANNLAYLQNNYAPALKRRINRAIDEGMEFDDAVIEAQKPMMSRIALYAGAAWVLMNAAKASALERKKGPSALNNVPVRRILDPRAEHCTTCPGKAGEYSSWNEMLMMCGGLPADGSDDCHSNCRCRIEVLDEGNWVYVV